MYPTTPFLFSIDLEDVRHWMPDGSRYAERVPAMAHQYLAWLERHSAKATFFVVGDVARAYPGLVREIAAAGHEVAAHSDQHIPLERLGREGFYADTARCLEALAAAGTETVLGYRAPIFSLTAATPWAYEVLAGLGFAYSSSVLPARAALYGWPGAATGPHQVSTPTGPLWELPVSLTPGWLGLGRQVPLAGGIYLRMLPGWLLCRLAQAYTKTSQGPLHTYLHPYDIDTGQERFMHPGIGGSQLYNALMYYGRGTVLPKLDALVALGLYPQRYDAYVDGLAAGVPRH